MQNPKNHIVQPMMSWALIEGFMSLAFTIVTGKLTVQTQAAWVNSGMKSSVRFCSEKDMVDSSSFLSNISWLIPERARILLVWTNCCGSYQTGGPLPIAISYRCKYIIQELGAHMGMVNSLRWFYRAKDHIFQLMDSDCSTLLDEAEKWDRLTETCRNRLSNSNCTKLQWHDQANFNY